MADFPSLEEALDEVVLSKTGCMRTSYIGRIINFDQTASTATVQPVVKSRYVDEDGEVEFRLPKPIHNVPVSWPQGAGYSITFPIEAGDYVMCVCTDRSIDEWKTTGGSANESQDPRRFDFMDSVILGGIRPFPDPNTEVKSDGMVIAAPSGGFVYLGDNTATDFVALASLVLAELQDIRAQFLAHTHDGVTSGGGVSGAATPASITYVPGSVAADKVKAT